MKGTGVSAGIACAKALKYIEQEITIPMDSPTDWQAEIVRFQAACQTVITKNLTFRDKALQKVGETEAEIFDAYLMLLEDEDSILHPIESLINTQGKNAVAAVEEQFNTILHLMGEIRDQHLSERAADLAALKEQIQRELLHIEAVDISHLEENVILVAKDLSPAETMHMDLEHIAGMICEKGGITSHTAILAKAMGIPAIVGCSGILDMVESGQLILMDGAEGTVIYQPSAHMLELFQQRAMELEERQALLANYIGKTTQTEDLHHVNLYANIASPQECSVAIKADCEGVGLFRSEFLFMGRSSLPSEEEQFIAYRSVLEQMEGRPVIIRTLDAGGDKDLEYLTLPDEENPFLGYRAIRICLDQPEIFRIQLRALYRASAYGNLQIMFPMIATLEEFRRAKKLAESVRQELTREGATLAEHVPLGMMIEIPSCAIIADALAKEADFFSIGTNDLTQYTLAVDRGNKKVASLYSHYHPAVIRLISHVIDCAHRNGIPCGMCGEAAGDPGFIPLLVGLGLDEFSMSASSILEARKLIGETSYTQWRKYSHDVMSAATLDEVKARIDKHN